jgi:hypothetical protein
MLTKDVNHGLHALSILENDLHTPIVNGKCNRERVEDLLLIAIYRKDIGPMVQEDVNLICEMLDDLIDALRKEE